MIGVYLQIVADYPLSLLIPLGLVIVIGVLHPIRRLCEGYSYNNAVSSSVGDALLVGCYLALTKELIADGIPKIAVSWEIFCAVVAVTAVIGFGWKPLKQTVADVYHAVVVAPIITVLIIGNLALLWDRGEGWHGLYWIVLATFIYTVGVDNLTGRAQQTSYLLGGHVIRNVLGKLERIKNLVR